MLFRVTHPFFESTRGVEATLVILEVMSYNIPAIVNYLLIAVKGLLEDSRE